MYFLESDTLDGIFNATINISTPDGRFFQKKTGLDGSINFSSIYNNDFVQGTYIVTLDATKGYITPITFNITLNDSNVPYNESFLIGKVGININVYNRETGTLLTGVPVNILMLGYFNVTTITGKYVFANLSITLGDHILQALADGYGTEQQVFTFTNQENITIDFYLLNLTGAHTGNLFAEVIDEFYRVVQGARVTLYEYNTGSKSFVQVSECDSNVNGECHFYIELNVKTYYLKARKRSNNIEYTDETNPEIIATDNDVRRLFLRLSNPFVVPTTDYINIDSSEYFHDNISEINVSFDTIDNSVITVCLEYFTISGSTKTSVYKSCTTSASGFIQRIAALNRSNSYLAQVYYLDNGAMFIYREYNYPSESSLSELFTRNNYAKPFILLLWLALFAVSFMLKNVTFLSFGIAVLSWVEFALFPTILMITGSVAKTIIALMLYNISRRKRDLN